MKLERSAVVSHLNRVACGSQIAEAVFGPGLSTRAMTVDTLLFVIADPLPKAEGLFAEVDGGVGLADLPTVIRAFGMLPGDSEAEHVNVKLVNDKLVLDNGARGVLRLLTAEPHTISSRVDDADADELLTQVPKKGGVPLTEELVRSICSAFTGFRAEEVELFVGPTGGRVRVGTQHGNVAEFASKDLKAPEKYSLLFGSHLPDVLARVEDYENARLFLAGPDKFITVQDGRYRFILDPVVRAADGGAEGIDGEENGDDGEEAAAPAPVAAPKAAKPAATPVKAVATPKPAALKAAPKTKKK